MASGISTFSATNTFQTEKVPFPAVSLAMSTQKQQKESIYKQYTSYTIILETMSYLQK